MFIAVCSSALLQHLLTKVPCPHPCIQATQMQAHPPSPGAFYMRASATQTQTEVHTHIVAGHRKSSTCVLERCLQPSLDLNPSPRLGAIAPFFKQRPADQNKDVALLTSVSQHDQHRVRHTNPNAQFNCAGLLHLSLLGVWNSLMSAG